MHTVALPTCWLPKPPVHALSSFTVQLNRSGGSGGDGGISILLEHHHSGLLSGLHNLSSSNTGTTGGTTGDAAAGTDARWKDDGQPLDHTKCD
mmetsp:Transcript_1514/g.2420  ORF Transcript_1514/g.2420 Transcript_1514/m.2420 type:complete len:93 (+) Transcript_1514:65-343(+)